MGQTLFEQVREEDLGFPSWVVEEWNRQAGIFRFPCVRLLTDSRRRAVRTAAKEVGSDQALWRAAITLYMKDADRWPERRQFGLDTMLRPCHRAKWFDPSAHDEARRADPFHGWTVE